MEQRNLAKNLVLYPLTGSEKRVYLTNYDLAVTCDRLVSGRVSLGGCARAENAAMTLRPAKLDLPR